jgi:hypothetical protein
MPNAKDKGKTPVISTVIAAFCIILYIGALSYGALSIFNSVTERRALADQEFDNLADLASASGVLGFMDESFIQTIQDAIDKSETLLGTVITSSKGEFAFERERGTVINWVNNSPRFVPRFAVTNPPKYLPLRIEGQRNVNIQAVSGYLDYEYSIGILKRTLLLVLFSLTLAFFTLLMDALLAKNGARASQAASGTSGPELAGPGRSAKTEQKPSKALAPQKPAGPSKQEVSGQEPSVLPAAEPIAEPSMEEPEEDQDIPEDFLPSSDDDDDDSYDEDDEDEFDFNIPGEDEAPQAGEEPIPGDSGEEAPEPEEQPPETGETPRGLFSPRSNVGWEAYTEDRLESELHRCASSEQDLTLIAMTFKEPAALSKEQFRLFCDDVVLFFEHRDLIFEYSQQGISVICPNCSLEQAIASSEEFSNRVQGKFSQPMGAKIDLRFGLSSRSGRLINAERLMLEAGEALKRAVGDTASHIVAFKSDPEKYRQYISRRPPR